MTSRLLKSGSCSVSARDEAAATVIERETWLLLAGRLHQIKRERQRLEDEADDSVKLVFDSHDQARVVAK